MVTFTMVFRKSSEMYSKQTSRFLMAMSLQKSQTRNKKSRQLRTRFFVKFWTNLADETYICERNQHLDENSLVVVESIHSRAIKIIKNCFPSIQIKPKLSFNPFPRVNCSPPNTALILYRYTLFIHTFETP